MHQYIYIVVPESGVFRGACEGLRRFTLVKGGAARGRHRSYFWFSIYLRGGFPSVSQSVLRA